MKNPIGLLISYLIIVLLFISFNILPVMAQDKENYIWQNKVFKEGIKTVQIYKSGWELSMPIIALNSEEKVTLEFDEINQTRKSYSYAVIHCTNDWKQSSLMPMEYLDGFETGYVEKSGYSQNTMVEYTNYRLDFPTDDCKLLVSGNYILKVYDDEPENEILTMRFYVLDKLIEISANIEKMNISLLEGQNQQLNFQLKFDEAVIENPFETLSFKISKNQETEKDFFDLKPSAITGNVLRYENIDDLAFIGGNEYRHFDTKSFKFLSDCLEKIEKQDKAYYIKLIADLDRTFINYKLETDLNGRRLIKLENCDRNNIMADYCYVDFELNTDIPIEGGNYYIFGALSNWTANDDFKLNYDADKQIFKKQVLIKQGYFNYKYVFKANDNRYNSEEKQYRVEGNHFQTENDYYIFVYYKPYNGNYQQLVGYFSKNSIK